MTSLKRPAVGPAAVIFLLLSGASVRADIRIEWRPPSQPARAGDVVSVGLFAVSDTAAPQAFRALSAVVTWDRARLHLIGVDNSQNGYSWLVASFPNDSQADRLNEDCGDAQYCPSYTGQPFNDGDAYFEALAKFAPTPMPEATSGGLRVTTFKFRVLETGPTQVHLIQSTGGISRTRVVGAGTAGADVTGTVGPAALIDVVAVTAEDLPDFLACLQGPGVVVNQDCRRFDADADVDVDLQDAAAFQNAFSSTTGP